MMAALVAFYHQPLHAQPAYGPINGAQWVRDNAGPRAVTQPPGTVVTFTTWQSLKNAIAANPAGSKFVHAAGGTITDVASVGQIDVTGKQPKIYFLGTAGVNSPTIDGGGAQLIAMKTTERTHPCTRARWKLGKTGAYF